MSNDTPDLRGTAMAGAIALGLFGWAVLYGVYAAVRCFLFMFWGVGL